MNNIIVVATNALGQSVTKVIKIESKTTPSGIIIDNLGDYENVTEIRIRGHVEPDTKVEVTNDTNGAKGEVTVVNDTFVCDIKVVAGNNSFKINATDKVGQKSEAPATVYIWTKKTVKLQVGSKVAVVDGIPLAMPTAPVVNKNGYTYIPLADVLTALIPGAGLPATSGNNVTVNFGTHVMTFTINQVGMTLDGTTITLKAAPYLQGAVIMFPLTSITYLTGNEQNVTIDILNDVATKTITVTRRW
jgi:hypothetical protein